MLIGITDFYCYFSELFVFATLVRFGCTPIGSIITYIRAHHMTGLEEWLKISKLMDLSGFA